MDESGSENLNSSLSLLKLRFKNIFLHDFLQIHGTFMLTLINIFTVGGVAELFKIIPSH